MKRIQISMIIGVVVFGLAAMALAILGLLIAFMSSAPCPSCGTRPPADSHATLYFVAGAACVVATVFCGVVMRRSGPTPRTPRPTPTPGPSPRKTNKLGLR